MAGNDSSNLSVSEEVESTLGPALRGTCPSMRQCHGLLRGKALILEDAQTKKSYRAGSAVTGAAVTESHGDRFPRGESGRRGKGLRVAGSSPHGTRGC